MGVKNSNVMEVFADPQRLSQTKDLGGRVRVAQGSVALTTDDLDSGDIALLAPIPSGAAITRVQIAPGFLDVAGVPTLTWDVGLYEADGTEVDADCFTAGLEFFAGSPTDCRFFGVSGVGTTGDPAWKNAGLAKDPGGHLFVGAAVAVAPTTPAAGDFGFIIEYVID